MKKRTRLYINKKNLKPADYDSPIIRKALAAQGITDVSVEDVLKGYNQFLKIIESNEHYKLTARTIQKKKTRAEKLTYYINSTMFTGRNDETWKRNMIRIISYDTKPFEAAVKDCGGDPDKWTSYILESDNPWTLGVMVNGYCIQVHVDATMYNDTAKGYSLEIA